jgi:hypothetical protein
MTIYQSIGSNIGTSEAAELADRLASWHDAMVSHERLSRTRDACGEDCPHTEAGPLWEEAVRTFGDRAAELRFLMSRGGLTGAAARRATMPRARAQA